MQTTETLDINFICSTSEKEVRIFKLTLSIYEINPGKLFGGLNVYYNVDDIDIYGNILFLDNLKTFLSKFLNIDFTSIEYSEWGLQGDDYVNFDVDYHFIREWMRYQISLNSEKYLTDSRGWVREISKSLMGNEKSKLK